MDLDSIQNPYKYLKKLLRGSGLCVHHITPRKLGGDNSWGNLSILTYEEHQQLHCEISMENPEILPLKIASQLMSGLTEEAFITSRSLGGRIGGRKNVESGHLRSIASLGAKSSVDTHGPQMRNGGLKGGKAAKESGQLQEACRLAALVNSGTNWYNNGITSKRFKQGEAPDGFTLGRAIQIKSQLAQYKGE